MSLPDLPFIGSNKTAVITGGANGIGLAAAQTLVRSGTNVALIDRDTEALEAAMASLEGEGRTLAQACDVSDASAMAAAAKTIMAELGTPSLLMNNAGTVQNPGKPWENSEGWHQLLGVNLGGIINGVQAFVPAMIEADNPAAIVNTGSKQGITLPPGNSAYNVSKAGIKAFTEMLAYELRNLETSNLTAHLLVPGFTYTSMIQRFLPEKPDGAWTSEQVVTFMFDSLARGDFYILCPDNDVDRPTDEKRVAWTAQDLIEGRPALSRWHPDFADAFEAFMKG